MTYKLFYHAGAFAGRGEPIRMLLSMCDGVTWEDTCKVKNAYGPAVKDCVIEEQNSMDVGASYPVLYPPALIDCASGVTVNQMSCILQYVGEKHGLAGANLEERTHALQIALTWNDLLENAMVAFHPVDLHGSYQSQKQEAQPHIKKFCETRLQKYLMYFEECLQKNGEGKGYMIGQNISFADVCMLNMMRGYKGSVGDHYDGNDKIPLLKGLEARLREEPKIKAFLSSDKTVDEFHDSFC